MYLIIVGAGDIGTPLIDIATKGGDEVVVIERDETRADRAAMEFDALVMHDDATVKETLEDAGADQADAIITTTGKDATNIMICLLSQELEIPEVVSVVHDTEHVNLYRQIGVNTIENPQALIAEYLYRGVKRPAIVDYMRVGETAEVFEIRVGADAPVAGKTLQEAADEGFIDEGMLVIAIERGGNGEPITPRGKTEIHAEDLLTVYSAKGATPDVTDIFGHYEDHA